MDNVISAKNNGLNLRQLFSTKNIYFDTSISKPFQYRVVREELKLPSNHFLYATDYPYTKRPDNDTFADGYGGPKQSGLFSESEMEGILRNNSLGLFPRLAKEYGLVS